MVSGSTPAPGSSPLVATEREHNRARSRTPPRAGLSLRRNCGGRARLGGQVGWVAAVLRDPMGCRRGSARRPGPEFLGVAYCPAALDPVACDVEREHRHGDAVLLSHQTGLAVDRAYQRA